MKRNIVLLILLMPFFAFSQSDLNTKKSSEKEIEKILVSELNNDLERSINTALINDIRKSEFKTELNKSADLVLNINRLSKDKLMHIIDVEQMSDMFKKFKSSRNSERQFGKSIDLKNSSEN